MATHMAPLDYPLHPHNPSYVANLVSLCWESTTSLFPGPSQWLTCASEGNLSGCCFKDPNPSPPWLWWEKSPMVGSEIWLSFLGFHPLTNTLFHPNVFVESPLCVWSCPGCWLRYWETQKFPSLPWRKQINSCKFDKWGGTAGIPRLCRDKLIQAWECSEA